MKEFALDQTHAHDLATESKQEPDAREVRRKVFRKANAGSASGQHVEPLEGGTGFSAAINAGLVVMRSGGGEVDQTATTLVARAAEGSGHGLPGELRGRFEQSLGTDLGGVRVHSDSAAGEASSALGARAYAVGQDVFMGAGQYDPGSEGGASLLAHEVAHTVQQRGASADPQCKLEVSEPGDAAEHEADRAAEAMIRGDATTVSAASGVARKIYRDVTPGAPATAAPAAAPAAAAPAASAPAGAAPAGPAAPTHSRQDIQNRLTEIEHGYNHIIGEQERGVSDLEAELGTADHPTIAETILTTMISTAINAATGTISGHLGSLAGAIAQAAVSRVAPAPAPAAGGGQTPAPAASPIAGRIATSATEAVKNAMKHAATASAPAIAGGTIGQPAIRQFANAQRTLLRRTGMAAQDTVIEQTARFLDAPNGYEEADAMFRAQRQTFDRAANEQHAASMAEWARSGRGNMEAGWGELLGRIAGTHSNETSLVVEVDMAEPTSNVSVAHARWPSLNDATRNALRDRHASRRIEELNPAMRIRIFTQRWRPFSGEAYFDLHKTPGESNVEFDHTGSPLLFLATRQNPESARANDPNLMLSAAQVAAQMIWLGIWQSPISRLGTITG